MENERESVENLLSPLRAIGGLARGADDARAQEKLLRAVLSGVWRDLERSTSDQFFTRVSRKYPNLSREDELELVRLAQNKKSGEAHQLARQVLVFYHMKMILQFARHVPKSEMSDVVQSGIIGLLNCIDKFNAGKKVRFNTFARSWIHKETSTYIAKELRLLHLTEGDQKLVRAFSKAKRELQAETSCEPSFDEVVTYCKWGRKKVQKVQRALNASFIASLDVCVERGQPLPDVAEQVDDNDERSSDELPSTELGEDETGAQISELLEMLQLLPPRWREILDLRYGLHGKPQTLQQVADIVGISVVRVHKLEGKAKKRIRELYLGSLH